MNKYIGHPLQLYGVEEIKLTSGKGSGMKMLLVRNAAGLEFMISVDRAADIARLSVKGVNYGYFAPCGYVAPQYFDNKGFGFLKSFNAGFLTTCGLTAVGSPCVDDGEELSLHGTISHIPCENIYHWIENDEIHIKATIRDAALFGHKLLLEREYVCPLYENKLYLTDKIKNIDWKETPIEVLYHCNIGYPILSENTKLDINYKNISARDEKAKAGISTATKLTAPQRGFVEECFLYTFDESPVVSVYNEKIGMGIKLLFDHKELPFFTQWKQLGEYEYALGIEPGNCHPDGRDIMRKEGNLEFLQPDEEKTIHLKYEFTE